MINNCACFTEKCDHKGIVVPEKLWRRRMLWVSASSHANSGVLVGESPMSAVDLKKWQCPLSLFFKKNPVDFEIV